MADRKNNLRNFFFDRLLNDPTRTSRLYLKKKPKNGSNTYGVSNRDFFLVGVGFSNTMNNVSITHNWGQGPMTSPVQKIMEMRNNLSQWMVKRRDQAKVFGIGIDLAKQAFLGDGGVIDSGLSMAADVGQAVAEKTAGFMDTGIQAIGNMMLEKYITAGEAAKFFQGTDINLEPNLTIPIVPRAFIASDNDPWTYKVWKDGNLVDENEDWHFKEGDIISTKWQLRKILNFLVGESGYGNLTIDGKELFTKDQKDATDTSTIVSIGKASFKVGALNKETDFSPFLMQKSPNDYIGNAIEFKYDCENTFRLVVGGRNVTGEDDYDRELGSSEDKSYSEENGAVTSATATTSNISTSIFDNLLISNVTIEESNIKVNMTGGSGSASGGNDFKSRLLTEDCPLYIMLRLSFVPAYMYDKFQLYEALGLKDKVQTAAGA